MPPPSALRSWPTAVSLCPWEYVDSLLAHAESDMFTDNARRWKLCQAFRILQRLGVGGRRLASGTDATWDEMMARYLEGGEETRWRDRFALLFALFLLEISPGRLWQTSEAVNHRLLLLEGTLTMGKDGMNERLFDFMTPDPYTRRFAHFLHLYIAVDA
ncbi:uncharacterized protein BKA78DRAFT_351662 [Phyllosticta capitalensis]|uniref:uncharacterized protein n=1 Tax=Phyllosticta capitalensis TaxID=121624 RepID=UPI00312F5D4B